MKVVVNSDEVLVKEIRWGLEMNDGHCPCSILKNDDTKCMCKAFRDQIAQGIPGKCYCGLYEAVKEALE